jgi:hypothetical protein
LLDLSPIEVSVRALRGYVSLEGRAVTREEILAVVAETVANYGSAELAEAAPARPLAETSGAERRRALAEAADQLLPSLPGASSLPAPGEPLSRLYADDPESFHTEKLRRVNALLPGDEYGPPDPRGRA